MAPNNATTRKTIVESTVTVCGAAGQATILERKTCICYLMHEKHEGQSGRWVMAKTMCTRAAGKSRKEHGRCTGGAMGAVFSVAVARCRKYIF